MLSIIGAIISALVTWLRGRKEPAPEQVILKEAMDARAIANNVNYQPTGDALRWLREHNPKQ